ncbi:MULTISPECIES: MFS transporter [unclassified Yoonia]|uniref:MFS transporter n=1 Tax=unclassified Yoonia TaxID=2629118 RepID=UPI002AFE7E7B|nr:MULTISPECIES: MFS transporter [unclassified Yoonia]
MTTPAAQKIFDTLTRKTDPDPDLPDAAQAAEPGNFLRHIWSLGASKLADGLIDPKLVLSWLLSQLGAGAFWVGLLVPVREAGALLPQLLVTPVISRAKLRKYFWAGGALVQGAAAAGIALVGLTQEGAVAGGLIIALLALLAVARSVCSASYKDVLGKTVGNSRRGTAMGLASSTGAVGVILFALVLMSGFGDRYVIVIAAIFLAAAFWLVSGLVFFRLDETPSEPAEMDLKRASFGLLRAEPQLRRFILTRSLLIGTALAPPYLVLLDAAGGLGELGALVLASALASLLSSFVWGRLSDVSSRLVLILAGCGGGGVLVATVALHLVGLTAVPLVLPALLFGLMIAHHGVRQGRNTQLVDMADEDQRTAFTALSNTIVGLVLIAGGALFAGIAAFSVPLVLGLFGGMCFGAAMLATGLEKVQND